ncbi:hypothetical protein GCM10009844_44030 [Nocardioides koreensis]|uniref:Allene oxide cyclase barrel-like domain-containing protein n=1 Tax=Nocardioides koreensis TaxID=433651 RepID=A0ABP5LYM8_9ACTN
MNCIRPFVPLMVRPNVPMSGRVLQEDAAVVEGDEFERVRADICASGPAGDGDNLLGMEMDCCAFLGDPAFANDDSGLWHDMTVRRSEGAEWLITGRAVGRFGDGPAVADALPRIWEEHLRYEYRSAHAVTTTPDSVLFRAVTQAGPSAIWVTAEVKVALT